MKRIIIFVFLAGFSIGTISVFKLKNKLIASNKVLSSNTYSQSPTPTTSPRPSHSPTPKNTPQPTTKPTPSPTPLPTPTPLISAPSDLEPLFEEFSYLYKVDKNKLKTIADCESHFNRGILADPYAGMYQFTTNTWSIYRNMMGKDANPNLRFGARESIETAAYILSVGKENIWPACSNK